MIAQNSTPTQKKRLCVLSDGTWNSPDIPKPSNIFRLSKVIEPVDQQGTKQLVFYDAGIGTDGFFDRYIGGAFGRGIDQNIKELYTFIASNYTNGDEVYMFGFSRGAYTVRSLAGFIHKAGLVRDVTEDNVDKAYEFYRDNPDSESNEAKEFREKHGDRISIDLVCAFDTVGALGIPGHMGWVDWLNRRRYEFHDTKLSNNIKHAIHLLSVDEQQPMLKPTKMEANASVQNQLTQLFFWGSHGGIGGSEVTEPECAMITMRFVVDEMERRGLGLSFNMSLIPEYPDVTIKHEITAGKVGLFAFIGQIFGQYTRQVERVEDIEQHAIERYQKVSTYRPEALNHFKKSILFHGK